MNKSFNTFYLSLWTSFTLFKNFFSRIFEVLAFHHEIIFNPLSKCIYPLFTTPYIPLWVFHTHSLRKSWIYNWILFIKVWELFFLYFKTSSSQFLNFLHSTIKTSLILFQNIFTPFSEFLLYQFECFIFIVLEHLD